MRGECYTLQYRGNDAMQALPSPPPGLDCFHLGSGVQSANPQGQVVLDVVGFIQETTDVNGVDDWGKFGGEDD